MFRKQYLAILVFAAGLAGIAATDSVSGVHDAHNNSAAPTARTGAPGELDCTSCHSGTVNSGGGTLSLTGLPANGYVPGQVYTLTVTVNDQSQPAATRKYGFSSTVLNSSNKMAGSFAVTNSSNTSTGSATVSGSSRSYMRHKTSTSSNSWSFNWTAPATNVGLVKFYVSGNAANGTGGDGGDKIYTANFALDAEALAPTATFTTSATTICEGQTVTFTNTSASATSYDWDFGNGSTAATAGPHTITYSQAGTYTAVLTATNTSGFDTQTVSITVNPLPAPTFTFTPTGLAPLLQAPAGLGTYTWYLDDVAIPNSNANEFQCVQQGTYKLCVTNANGCTACTDNTSITWSATDPAKAATLNIAPNPAGDYVRVSLPQGVSRLELTDVTGRVIRSLAHPAAAAEVSLAGLPAGVYHLRATLAGGSIAHATLVKE